MTFLLFVLAGMWALLLVALVVEAIAKRVAQPAEYADRSRGYRD